MDIILTGGVAVGKSTLARNLAERIPCFIFPEFIDERLLLSSESERDESKEMLRKRFAKEISPFEFQDYILKRWESFAKKSREVISPFRIFERLPDDSVEVFARPIVNDEEYSKLKSHLDKVNTELPSYHLLSKRQVAWIDFDNDFSNDKFFRLLSTITAYKGWEFETVIVNITNANNFANYLRRNRSEESYSIFEMESLNSNYERYMEKIQEEIKPVAYLRI